MLQPQPEICLITDTAPIETNRHGGRAKCLQRLVRLNMPVPVTVALSFNTVRSIARDEPIDLDMIFGHLPEETLFSVRPSSEDPDWGGPGAILNIGMTRARRDAMAADIGEAAANALYLRFIQAYALHVARLDPDEFSMPDDPTDLHVKAALDAYEFEMDEPFPDDPKTQLMEVLRSMARAWDGTSARLLREAKGAPADAGLGLVVQSMALGIGDAMSGSGVVQFIDPVTGRRGVRGRYLRQSQGRDALSGDSAALYIEQDPRGPSIEERMPGVYADLMRYGEICRLKLKEEMQIEFVVERGVLSILDAVKVVRSSQAAVCVAVALANDHIISREEAIIRTEAETLSEMLHRQIVPDTPRDVFAKGIAASPGAATGRIVLTSNEAQAAAARGEPVILVRWETSPEDIRGMHAAQAVVTVRGGLTSHAAVIGRGLGLPCVVGANDLTIDKRDNLITTASGRVFSAGDMITVDGTSGELIAGAMPMLEASIDGAFGELLEWADEFRDIGVRANADTPQDAITAQNFAAEGIGLCRTEHMFFDGERLGVMREMIFASNEEARRAVLARLLPMQEQDFFELFTTMKGQPVCIRLFDPPLHEFLPFDKAGMRALAEQLSMPLADVEARTEALSEYNPMLGMRGVRLGLNYPEIYDMQARAILLAAHKACAEGIEVMPEIMLPLVSAIREVAMVERRIDAVAHAIAMETGKEIPYKLGVMVETPRAALRAEDIATHASFLSFGTNDLTQMTYGLSRDDAGRFMSAYVRDSIYPEDPFLILDSEGVGELLAIGAERGRKGREDITLSICGEHGGSRSAIEFCRSLGFDYVSCSPYRVPNARLIAAQLAIEERRR